MQRKFYCRGPEFQTTMYICLYLRIFYLKPTQNNRCMVVLLFFYHLNNSIRALKTDDRLNNIQDLLTFKHKIKRHIFLYVINSKIQTYNGNNVFCNNLMKMTKSKAAKKDYTVYSFINYEIEITK